MSSNVKLRGGPAVRQENYQRRLSAPTVIGHSNLNGSNKTFGDYKSSFLLIGMKYLPQMPDETQRRYLFVAIDRAKCSVYLRLYRHQIEASSTDFFVVSKWPGR